MTEAGSLERYLADPRLAALATSDRPVWLWSANATQILWANPVGAAILVSQNPAPVGAQIIRFSATLPVSGASRLQRLRGLGTGPGQTLLCKCSRIELFDRTPAVLLEVLEPAGPPLTLAERARRLLQSCKAAVGVFTPEGHPLFATASAHQFLGRCNLAGIGAEHLGREAILLGHATGRTAHGPVSVARLGHGSTTVLVATFSAPPAQSPAEAENARSIAISGEPAITSEPTISSGLTATAHATATSVPTAADISAGLPIADSTPAPETTVPLNLYLDVPLDLPVRTARPSEIAETALPKAPAPQELEITAEVMPDISLRERRHPLRFVWEMDVDGRFTLGSDEFMTVIGPNAAKTLGRRWSEIAFDLGLDPEGHVARAITSRDTWSGITVSWPVDGSSDRLKIELSGLPVYDHNRTFLGYRGFGVCRDIERLAVLAARRRNDPTLDVTAAGIPPVELQSHPTTRDVTGASSADGERPPLVLVPSAKNVVPFRAASAVEQRAHGEHNAFRDMARQSTQHRDGKDEAPAPGNRQETLKNPEQHSTANEQSPGNDKELAVTLVRHPLIEKLPVGILVYRVDQLLYANGAFLEWTGYSSLEALAEAGGLESLFIEPDADASQEAGPDRTLAIATNRGDRIPVEGRLHAIAWDGETALALILSPQNDRRTTTEGALQATEAKIATLSATLDAVTDGVIVIDRDARVLFANRAAHALFDFVPDELQGFLGDVLAPENGCLAVRYLDQVANAETDSIVHDSVEISAQTRAGTLVPVLMTISRVTGSDQRFYVVLQDLTTRKRIEQELVDARRQAERAFQEQSELLTKISHEIRTPINSIVAFSEVMLEERFGPIGNERYRSYLKDIGASGTHVVSMLSDLIDLSRIETGKLTLSYVSTSLNELVQSCVAQVQSHASHERIVIRMSLSPSLPAVVADVPSLKQIVVSLLNNSINFTSVGGQVIVSTALSDAGETVLRVRDTGIGMSDKDVEAALAPFRQRATRSTQNSIGSGLGLALTKALAEANRARFNIVSKVGDGTLVEITFPSPNTATISDIVSLLSGVDAS
jgi:PAS domain S-box-containing protein